MKNPQGFSLQRFLRGTSVFTILAILLVTAGCSKNPAAPYAGAWLVTKSDMQSFNFSGLEFMNDGTLLTTPVFGQDRQTLKYKVIDNGRLILTQNDGTAMMCDTQINGDELKLTYNGNEMIFQHVKNGETLEQALAERKAAREAENKMVATAIDGILGRSDLVLMPAQTVPGGARGMALELKAIVPHYSSFDGKAWCDEDPPHTNQVINGQVFLRSITFQLGPQVEPPNIAPNQSLKVYDQIRLDVTGTPPDIHIGNSQWELRSDAGLHAHMLGLIAQAASQKVTKDLDDAKQAAAAGDWDTALMEARKALWQNPGDKDFINLIRDIAYKKGMAEARAGLQNNDLDAAVDGAESAVTRNPESTEALDLLKTARKAITTSHSYFGKYFVPLDTFTLSDQAVGKIFPLPDGRFAAKTWNQLLMCDPAKKTISKMPDDGIRFVRSRSGAFVIFDRETCEDINGTVLWKFAPGQAETPLGLSPDGKLLAAWWPSKGFSLFDASTGADVKDFSPAMLNLQVNSGDDSPSVWSGFSRDGKYVAIRTADWAWNVVDTTSGQVVHQFPCDRVASYAAFGGDHLLAYTTADAISVVDTSNWQEVANMHLAGGICVVDHALQFTPDGNILIALGRDSAWRLFNANTGDQIGATLPDNFTLLSADGSVLLLYNGQEFTAYHTADAKPFGKVPMVDARGYALTADGRLIVSHQNGTVDILGPEKWPDGDGLRGLSAHRVIDTTNFFDSGSLQRANETIANLKRQYGVDVVVNSSPGIPGNLPGDQNFQNPLETLSKCLADEEASDGTPGLYLLITRFPKQITWGELPASPTDALHPEQVASLKQRIDAFSTNDDPGQFLNQFLRELGRDLQVNHPEMSAAPSPSATTSNAELLPQQPGETEDAIAKEQPPLSEQVGRQRVMQAASQFNQQPGPSGGSETAPQFLALPKVITVDMNRVFTSYYKTKDAGKQIDGARSVDKQALAAEVRDESAKDIADFKKSQEDQIQSQAVTLRNRILTEIESAIQLCVSASQFNLLFDNSGNSLNGVPVILYASDSADISDSVSRNLSGSSVPNVAPSPLAPESLQWAFVNMNRIFASYYKTKSAEAQVNKDRSAAKEQLDAKLNEYKALVAEINGLAADSAARNGKVQAARQLQGEIEAFRVSREKQLQDEAVKYRNDIVSEIMADIHDLIKANGWTLVADSSGNSLNYKAPFFVYLGDFPDLSDSVIARLNQSESCPTPPPLGEIHIAKIDLGRVLAFISDSGFSTGSNVNSQGSCTETTNATLARIQARLRDTASANGYNLVIDSSATSFNGIPFVVKSDDVPDLTAQLIA